MMMKDRKRGGNDLLVMVQRITSSQQLQRQRTVLARWLSQETGYDSDVVNQTEQADSNNRKCSLLRENTATRSRHRSLSARRRRSVASSENTRRGSVEAQHLLSQLGYMSTSRRRSDSSTMSELPPIYQNNRPSSGKSRKSSKDSSNGGLPRASMHRYEKPALISLDCNPADSSSRPGSQKKRSQLSPGSSGSSGVSQSISAQSNVITQLADNNGLNRAKSWCATDGSGGNIPKLETLHERNGIIEPREQLKMTKTNTFIAQGTGQKYTPTRHASTGSSNAPQRNYLNKPPLNESSLPTKRTSTFSSKTARGGGLTRHRSEQNIHLSSMQGSMTSRTEKSGKHGGSGSQHPGRPLHKTKSQPYMVQYGSSRSCEGRLNAQNLKVHGSPQDNDNDIDFEDGDTTKERIIEWLIGVDSDAERPPSPEVFEDAPLQTDTAIHVVYKDA